MALRPYLLILIFTASRMEHSHKKAKQREGDERLASPPATNPKIFGPCRLTSPGSRAGWDSVGLHPKATCLPRAILIMPHAHTQVTP